MDETPIILNSVIWQLGKELLLLKLRRLGLFLFMFIFLHLSPKQRGTVFSGSLVSVATTANVSQHTARLPLPSPPVSLT